MRTLLLERLRQPVFIVFEEARLDMVDIWVSPPEEWCLGPWDDRPNPIKTGP